MPCGCGQDNHIPWVSHRMEREAILHDSLHYWVQELYVNGFRFDLAWPSA
jgi:pullulanase/glycogen debranching enzyme